MTHYHRGELVYVRFYYNEPIGGMKGVYRPSHELEPAHVVAYGLLNQIKVRFLREPILVFIEVKDIDMYEGMK